MLPLASPVASSARAEPHPIHIHDQLDQAPASSARDQAQARSRRQAQAQEIRDGLRGSAPRIAPKFLYDPAGCDLYERLVEVPEYYLPRVERRILNHHQPGMLQRLPGNAQLIDLGCGDGLKARRWLASGQVSRYVGVDIAGDWLRGALQSHRALYPQIQFDGVITDFSQRLHLPTVLDDPGRASSGTQARPSATSSPTRPCACCARFVRTCAPAIASSWRPMPPPTPSACAAPTTTPPASPRPST